MKTTLYFKDRDSNLRGVTYGKPDMDIESVNNQPDIKKTIKELGHDIDTKRPVLCLIQM